MPVGRARIERMTIEVPGGSAHDARQLALLVAAGLAQAGALPQAGDIPRLRVEVAANRGQDTGALAQHVLAATLRQLRRAP